MSDERNYNLTKFTSSSLDSQIVQDLTPKDSLETNVALNGLNGHLESSAVNSVNGALKTMSSIPQKNLNVNVGGDLLARHKVKHENTVVPPPVHVSLDDGIQPLWRQPLLSKSGKEIESSLCQRYTIEYSVFKPVENLIPILNESDFRAHLDEMNVLCDLQQCDNHANSKMDPQLFSELFFKIMRDTQNDKDLKPIKISQGSSGSYFILSKRESSDGTLEIFKQGIFKPKDEEPYGPLSPKWTKWLHRTFFPCFFGRSCLIPNLGYISEAAACVLDRQLLSFIVPYTDVVFLKSLQFYYSFWERTTAKHGRYKIGSFQMFLNDYVEAAEFFKVYPLPQDLDVLPIERDFFFDINDPLGAEKIEFQWSKKSIAQFKEELEKLVILDYIMRNTDRGHDNWMIKLEWCQGQLIGEQMHVYPFLKIGAIDSGLAFPWKHPNEWRSFPFGWLFLPYSIIGQPFSLKTRNHYLPLLTSTHWWEQTVIRLKSVFMKDEDFKERMWSKQIAVLKGQAFNVVEILKLHYAGPLELTRRENLMIWDDLMNVPIQSSINTPPDNSDTSEVQREPHMKDRTSSYVNSRLTETTPLLDAKATARMKLARASQSPLIYESVHMSGFEFNLNMRDEERAKVHTEDETNTKNVVIERLEKVHSKPPVFTWC